MRTVTATELSRNFRVMFNRVEFLQEELLIVRNNSPVARLKQVRAAVEQVLDKKLPDNYDRVLFKVKCDAVLRPCWIMPAEG